MGALEILFITIIIIVYIGKVPSFTNNTTQVTSTTVLSVSSSKFVVIVADVSDPMPPSHSRFSRLLFRVCVDRPLSFISLSHSDNQSESVTKFYNSFKADVGGNVLTLT